MPPAPDDLARAGAPAVPGASASGTVPDGRRPGPVAAARGVSDVMPDEHAAWSLVQESARAVSRAFGYSEIEVPVIERVELVERGVGADTDAGGKELYRLQKLGSEELVLRPEATAGVTRAFFQHQLDQAPQPARLFTLGPMFRHDRPQAGRYRQFHQFDLEAIGDPAPGLDAEVIEIAMAWLDDLGIVDSRLEVNSIGDPECRPAYLQALRDFYAPHEAELCAQCRRRLVTNPLRLLDCKEPVCSALRERAPRLLDHLCEPCAAHFAEVRALLEAAGLEPVLNPYLVRGLDYYTRTVFEVQHPALGGSQNSLGGGGRYDGLATALGYPQTPAVGFAAGLERILLAMRASGEELEPGPAAELLVLPAGDGLSAAAAEVGRLGRQAVPTAVDYSARSLKAKMRAANRQGPRWVAIFGAEEADRRVVQLKELAGGEQREVAWDELATILEESW